MPTVPATSPITRSWKTTFINLGIGIALLALAVWMWMDMVEGPITIGIACLPSIGGLIMIYMAYAGAGTGVCPLCNKVMTGIADGGGPTVCDSCHKYLDTKDQTLRETDPNRIENSPTFASVLPDKFNFPEGCCICGNPADHREKIQTSQMSASSAVTAPTIGVTSTSTVSVEVPHCAEHKGGASLSGTAKNTKIHFRSYPYLRAFCEINNTTPG